MKQPTIRIFLGVSGAGKDTTAGFMIKGTDGRILKMAAPGKRMFEQVYSLPEGVMDDRVARLATCPGTKDTYLDRFIYWFHHQGVIFPPGFFLTQALAQVTGTLEKGRDVFLTDTRNLDEIDAILALPYPVQVYHITGRGKALSSDIYLDDILNAISAKSIPVTLIDNSARLC